MKIRSLAVCATAILLPLAATSCSEETTGDLSKGEITEELTKAGIPADQADCVADALIAGDFSKSELDDISSGETTSGEKYDTFLAATMECIAG